MSLLQDLNVRIDGQTGEDIAVDPKPGQDLPKNGKAPRLTAGEVFLTYAQASDLLRRITNQFEALPTRTPKDLPVDLDSILTDAHYFAEKLDKLRRSA